MKHAIPRSWWLALVVLLGVGAIALTALLAPRPRGAATVGDPAAILASGWDAVDRQDAGAARVAIRGLRAAGEPLRASLLEARLLVARGFAAAALDLLAGIDADGDPATARLALLVRGETAYRLKTYPAAERDLAAVIAADPDAVDAHRLLGAMYYDAGVIPVSIHHLGETARLAPTDHRPSRLLGLIHNDFERYDEAIGHYRESLRRAPDQADRDEVLTELAACEVKLRRHREALETLGRIAAPGPAAEVLRAECLLAIGEQDRARAIVDGILASAPDHLGALVLAGTIRLEEGDAAGAVANLEHAVAAHPSDYLARVRLAQALAGSGRDDDAARERGEAERIRATRRAFADLHQAAWDAPGDAEVRRTLAAMARELGRPDLEGVWLEAAAAIEAGR